MVLSVAYSQSENFIIKRMGRFGGSRMGRGLFDTQHISSNLPRDRATKIIYLSYVMPKMAI